MFQPNKELRAVLVAAVKPEFLQDVTERIIEHIMVYNNHQFCILYDKTTTGSGIVLNLSPKNFDEVLEFGKWYPREKFDKNPCNHILLEFDSDGNVICSHCTPWNTDLYSDTVTFMYVKKP